MYTLCGFWEGRFFELLDVEDGRDRVASTKQIVVEQVVQIPPAIELAALNVRFFLPRLLNKCWTTHYPTYEEARGNFSKDLP